MRYFEIVKPTTYTISAATDTTDAEALTKQSRSSRPNGVEINYPIRPIGWRTPPPGAAGSHSPGLSVPNSERDKS